MQDKNINKIQKLFRGCKSLLLTTINSSGYPETRAMLNIANVDICPHLTNHYDSLPNSVKEVYFTTNLSSKKTNQIKENNKANVYFFMPENFGGALLIGTAEVVEEQSVKDIFWTDSWEMYYPKGRTDPDYVVIKFTAQKYKFYDGNLRVEEGAI